jgi:hypothetical protein
MNNNLAGTPGFRGSDIYPDQSLTTQSLHADYGYTACDACNSIPQPAWSLGSCRACDTGHANSRRYYLGADVGDARMTGTQDYVPIPGHFVTQPVLRQVATCDLATPAAKRGASWQDYNLSSTCSHVA